MGGIKRTDDGTCVRDGCDNPVEYIAVRRAQTSSFYDLCPEHFLYEAKIETWEQWMNGPCSWHEDEGTCEYRVWRRGSSGGKEPCGEHAHMRVRQLEMGTAILVCPGHATELLVDNILVETGWGAVSRVEPGWTPASSDDEAIVEPWIGGT